MRSTFYGLEVARTGLYTAQNQLNVTGHNISNVDTLGYTRQRLNTAAIPASYLNGQFAADNRAISGRGVETKTVEQVRDQFLDAKYRENASDTGYWNTKMSEFYMVEQLYNSALDKTSNSSSISTALGAFQTALYALEENPAGKEVRTNVLTKANQLAETFAYTYGKLEEQHENLNNAVNVTVGQINDISQSIANLNLQIFGYELTGAKANDLRDSRNLLLDQLSGMVDVNYSEDSKGQLNITIGGRTLVSGADYNKLAVDPQGAENQMDVVGNADVIRRQYSVVWADEMGKPSKDPADVLRLQSGSLKAYIDLRDGTSAENVGVPYAAKQLNEMVRKIAQEVNSIHCQGYTMPYMEKDSLGTSGAGMVRRYTNDNPAVADTSAMPKGTTADGTEYYESVQGIYFFEVGPGGYDKINASTFKVSTEIQNNVYLIAASDAKLTVEGELNDDGSLNMKSGNASNLKKIIALDSRKDALGNPDNYSSRLKLMVTDIGTQQSQFNTLDKAQQTRIFAIHQQRASVSSVSLDEEMTNVVRFTHAYNASARIITAIDEELDTLINKMGLVGR